MIGMGTTFLSDFNKILFFIFTNIQINEPHILLWYNLPQRHYMHNTPSSDICGTHRTITPLPTQKQSNGMICLFYLLFILC